MITSIRRFVLRLSWIGRQDLLHIVHGPQDPFIDGTLRRPLVVFSDVDVGFAMSRCCILPSRASVPPSMSRMILLSELILTTCKWLCICICMSLMTTVLYIPCLWSCSSYIMNDSIHLLHPLLNWSLMFLAGWLTILHLHPILPQWCSSLSWIVSLWQG